MNKDEVLLLAKELLDKHVHPEKGWEVNWLCKEDAFEYKTSEGVYHTIAQIDKEEKKLLIHPKIYTQSDEKIKDTILHEIAHILVNNWHGNREICQRHDEVWEEFAKEIGCNNFELLGIWRRHDQELDRRFKSRRVQAY